jgi:hypothetical protein
VQEFFSDDAQAEASHAEFIRLEMSALEERALAAGVAQGAVDGANKEGDPKEAIIELLLQADVRLWEDDATWMGLSKQNEAKGLPGHRGLRVESATILGPLRQLMNTLAVGDNDHHAGGSQRYRRPAVDVAPPASSGVCCRELVFDNVPLGSAGLRMIAEQIMAAAAPTELRAIRFRNARLADTSMRMNLNNEWQQRGRSTTVGNHHSSVGGPVGFQGWGRRYLKHCLGMAELKRALASEGAKRITEVEIKGFVTERGVDAFLPNQHVAEDEALWARITKNEVQLVPYMIFDDDPMAPHDIIWPSQYMIFCCAQVRFVLDLNSSLNPANAKIMSENLRLGAIRASGNSYEGDGIHHIAEALGNSIGAGLTEVAVDASRTTDFEILELLAAALAHEHLEKITVVWVVEDDEDVGLTELAKELLQLNTDEPMCGRRYSRPLDADEYYRQHHCVDFSERQRANFIKSKKEKAEAQKKALRKLVTKAQMSHEKAQAWCARCSKEMKSTSGKTNAEGERTGPWAQELVIDRSMLSYPITFALKLADICNEVAGREDRADKQAELTERAQIFETIATQIFDECPNEYVAERVLRGSKTRALLDGVDLFTWVIERVAPPQRFICSKWCQNYIAKIWCHADLSWRVSSNLCR